MRCSIRVVGYSAAIVIAMSLWPGVACAQVGVERDAQEAAHASALEAEQDSGPNPLAVDPDLAIWTLVVFVLLFAILKKFAWPQIAEAIDERERLIAGNIAAAAAQHEEAKRLLAEHQAQLAAAAGEVRALLEEARRDADVTKRRIEEEGHKAATDEVARAAREIERAKDNALHELAVTSANLAIEMGQKVVREKLEISPEHRARIVREALGKLAAATASDN